MFFYLIFIGFVFLFLLILFLLFSIRQCSRSDTKKRSDVILVLGALPTIRGSAKKNPCLTARVNHGIQLLEDGFAPYILFSGGRRKGERTNESAMMGDLAEKQGVDTKQILLEQHAHSTYENILYAKQLMEEKNLHSAILVTDPYHMLRSMLVAKKLRLQFSSSPASQSPCALVFPITVKFLLTEALALIYYKIKGII